MIDKKELTLKLCFSYLMKKSKRVELDDEQLERVVSMAQEERKPFEVLKAEFGITENEVTELMRKRLSKDNFELWKRKFRQVNQNQNQWLMMTLTI